MKGLYKFSFYTYFKSVCYAPVVRLPLFASLLMVYCILGLNFFGAFSSDNEWVFLIEFLCCMVFLAGIIMGNYFQRTPDLASLMPISPKRNLLYRFLSVLLMFVIMVVVITLLILVVSLIVLAFSFAPSCNYGDGDDGTVIVEETSLVIGVYGGIFSAAYFIALYSVGIISGFIRRRMYRNIFAVGVCVCGVLSYIFMNLPYKFNPDFGNGAAGIIFTSPFVNECYEAMKCPQLCIALWCVLAAALLGTAIYLGLREIKLKGSY